MKNHSTILKQFKDDTLMLLSSTDYWQDAKFEDTEDLTEEDETIVNPYQYSAAQVSYQIDCNSQFMWTQFEIPWEQLPRYMILACESGKRDNQIINFIIHTVVNKMREIKTIIPSSAIKIITNKLIDKYPGVFRDVDEDGVVIGDGTYSIFRKIQDRNNYLNRPNKRKTLNENKKPVSNKKKHVTVTASLDVNDASLENRIIETFGEQRSFLNENPSIEEIQKVWPILLKEKAALIHFQQLTRSNLYTLEYTVKEKLPKFLKLLPNYISSYENPEELLQVLEILTIYFKENLDCIFLEQKNVQQSEQFPLHPIMVRIGYLLKRSTLIKNGYSYSVAYKRSDKTFFLCSSRRINRCKSRAVLEQGDDPSKLKVIQEHTHPPDYMLEKKAEIWNLIKQFSITLPGKPAQVYSSVVSLYPETEDLFPFKSVEDSIRGFRKRYQRKLTDQ